MGKYFSVSELCVSRTARRLGIVNKPSAVEVKHMEELVELLDGLREWCGKPLCVTSGYRCVELNRVVGGVLNSAHCYGWAADIVPRDGDWDVFVGSVLSWIDECKPRFDQVVFERVGDVCWLHIGVRRWDGVQRCEVKYVDK